MSHNIDQTENSASSMESAPSGRQAESHILCFLNTSSWQHIVLTWSIHHNTTCLSNNNSSCCQVPAMQAKLIICVCSTRGQMTEGQGCTPNYTNPTGNGEERRGKLNAIQKGLWKVLIHRLSFWFLSTQVGSLEDMSLTLTQHYVVTHKNEYMQNKVTFSRSHISRYLCIISFLKILPQAPSE